jgi:hypothetical protein
MLVSLAAKCHTCWTPDQHLHLFLQTAAMQRPKAPFATALLLALRVDNTPMRQINKHLLRPSLSALAGFCCQHFKTFDELGKVHKESKEGKQWAI